MAYIAKNNVVVFPSARRARTQLSARLMSENAVARILNQLVDVDGFVISDYPTINTSDNIPFEFNIHGYYFKIDNAAILIALDNSWTNIWAEIEIDVSASSEFPDNPDGTYPELKGQDNGSNYEGIVFTSTEPTTATNKYKLHLLTKSGNTWTIPEESKLKFFRKSISLNPIDGGVV